MASFCDDESEIYVEEETPVLSVPEGGEDWEGAATAKQSANEAKACDNLELAVEMYTKALELGTVSAMTLASRAECLLKLRRPKAALADCNAALEICHDSAKALRCRGTVYRHLGKWEEANLDMSEAQRIDFNPDFDAIHRFVIQKAAEIRAAEVQHRIEEEEKLRERVRKQREEMKQREEEERAEEEKRRSEQESSGFPGGFPGGMPEGMGGMPGAEGIQQVLMQLLMSDPELSAGLQNPKIMKAFTGMMSGDTSASSDPEVAAYMEKLQAKLGPLMGMMGGGMGGMPGGMESFPEDDGEDEAMPDLEEADVEVPPPVEEVD